MNGVIAAGKRALQWVTQLFHPRRCVFCRKALPIGVSAMVCTECAPRVRREYRNTSAVHVPGADAADAPLLYKGEAARALKQYKFRQKTALCRWLSAQAGACLAGHLTEWEPDCITYIPLGAARWWSRGFNQSEAAARQIGKTCGIPVRAAIGKRPWKGRQSSRTAEQRRQAAKDEFFPLPGHSVRGKTVVLVDDIITTGATSADAVRALREAGASRVYVLALAVTPKKTGALR